MRRVEVDYKFYTDEFKGSFLKQALFDSFVTEAEAIVNECTDGRVHEYMDDLTEDDMYCVKLAICSVADVLKTEKRKIGISSENTDGYSVSYESGLSLIQKTSMAARKYLIDTTLLSRRAGYVYKR